MLRRALVVSLALALFAVPGSALANAGKTDRPRPGPAAEKPDDVEEPEDGASAKPAQLGKPVKPAEAKKPGKAARQQVTDTAGASEDEPKPKHRPVGKRVPTANAQEVLAGLVVSGKLKERTAQVLLRVIAKMEAIHGSG